VYEYENTECAQKRLRCLSNVHHAMSRRYSDYKAKFMQRAGLRNVALRRGKRQAVCSNGCTSSRSSAGLGHHCAHCAVPTCSVVRGNPRVSLGPRVKWENHVIPRQSKLPRCLGSVPPKLEVSDSLRAITRIKPLTR
jgi:hypothetical protein